MASHLSTSITPPYYPSLDSNLAFSDYIAQCQQFIQDRRTDLQGKTNDHILLANSPFEHPPTTPIKKGALFIHGLFDSPFSSRELSTYLQTNGILCRSILLPGHGTRPEDLLGVSYKDWIKAVSYGIESLRKEVDQLFLVGYSTGAALSLYHALEGKAIDGLILLAPAIKIKPQVTTLLTYHQLINKFYQNKGWVCKEPEVDYTKYRSIAFNPVIQVNQLARLINTLPTSALASIPMLMVLPEEDETVSSLASLKFFNQFQHERSQVLLYTRTEEKYKNSRIITRPSAYPQRLIAHVSHIGLPFSASNLHYGEQGDYPYASHFPSEKVRYGAYNRLEETLFNIVCQLGVTKERRCALTYNPDFDFMARTISNFIQAS